MVIRALEVPSLRRMPITEAITAQMGTLLICKAEMEGEFTWLSMMTEIPSIISTRQLGEKTTIY